MAFLGAIAGLVILAIGGDLLVRGAVNLSLRLGIPALIVSLTVVSFGTSAPEMLIGVAAVMDGVPDIAMGNVVGSNTANILLILGVPALISRLRTSEVDTRDSYSHMIVASLVFVALAFLGPITWIHGIILLLLLALSVGHSMFAAYSHHRSKRAEGVEGAEPSADGWKVALYLIIGLISLPIGASMLVDNSVVIARNFGISESVIGLTLVAVGTSAPELATTIMAAIRRQADVVLGNAIGSNMFNILAIIGVSSFFGDIPVADRILLGDVWVMIGASAVLVPFVFFGVDITRRWGFLLTGLYVIYTIELLS